MRTHQELWTLATLLLLVAGAIPGRVHADSPTWADEQMLLPWPEALGATVPAHADLQTASQTGHALVSDDALPYGHSVGTLASMGDDVVHLADHIDPAGLRLPAIHPQEYPCSQCYGWHILPAGILYKSYIAGTKEPRMAAVLHSEKDRGLVFDGSIGGRLGFVRYGTVGPINPQGFQWDLEGAALLRQDIEQELDVEAVDFRVGTVLTWREGPTAVKAGYYHLSSHLGDEFLIRNVGYPRLNYVRDALLFGVRHAVRPDVKLYGEVAYSFKTDGGAEPLELQFGLEYTPIDLDCNRTSAPVFAINGHLREEFDYGGSVNIIAGWEWRGPHSDRRLRIGGQYYNGKEIQWSFFNESVAFTGIGVWYDF